MNEFFNTKHTRLLGSLVLLMAVIAMGSYASLNFEKKQYIDPSPATIVVSGEGEVLAVPDIGKFSFSVTAEDVEAATAQEESGKKVNDILAFLREQGIEDKDIKVEYYNLYPKYRWEERVCALGSYCPPGERVQDGFEVTQQVAVKVRDTKQAPAVITGVGERGATNISNLTFTIDDTDALQAEARAEAIADAQAKAKVLAEQLGVRLVKISAFYEEGNGRDLYYKTAPAMMDMAVEEAGFGGAEMPVGEESTKVNVSVTYEIR